MIVNTKGDNLKKVKLNNGKWYTNKEKLGWLDICFYALQSTSK